MDQDEIYQCLQEHTEHLNTHTDKIWVTRWLIHLTIQMFHAHMHSYRQSIIYRTQLSREVSGYSLIEAASFLITN